MLIAMRQIDRAPGGRRGEARSIAKREPGSTRKRHGYNEGGPTLYTGGLPLLPSKTLLIDLEKNKAAQRCREDRVEKLGAEGARRRCWDAVVRKQHAYVRGCPTQYIGSSPSCCA